jgi:hypothetical protein
MARKLRGWLEAYLIDLRREVATIAAMGHDLVELDIQRRTLDAS